MHTVSFDWFLSGLELIINLEFCLLKPNQNKKGQKNLGYPIKKQSFYKEKDCFFVGYPKFFWPFLFWSGFKTFDILTEIIIEYQI